MLRRTFCNRRVLIFVDNDAARFCLIKGLSRSSTMSSLIEAFDSLDGNDNDPMLYWIERVASFSNIADGPSKILAQVSFVVGRLFCFEPGPGLQQALFLTVAL